MRIHSVFRSGLQRLRRYFLSDVVPPPSQSQTLDDVLSADPERWLEWMDSHALNPIRSFQFRLPENVNYLQIDCCGAAWHELAPHLWLHRLPEIDLQDWSVEASLSQGHRMTIFAPQELGNLHQEMVSIAINLELPPLDRALDWLKHLRGHILIFDPDPARVNLLRALGLNAEWLNPQGVSNHWLRSSGAVDADLWSHWLGLPAPNPDHLMVLGRADRAWESASAAEAFTNQNHSCLPHVDYWPGWPELIVESPMEGLARAGWLQSAAQVAARLVHAGASFVPDEWHLLDAVQAQPFCLQDLSTPEDLRFRHGGHKELALAEERNAPKTEIRWEWTSGQPPQASVLVSLHNYSGRIVTALEGVADQKGAVLELIVVDDASTDDGALVVAAWMEEVHARGNHPFVRLLLLSHCLNSGLAVARNTAFASAQAGWCFVLDADNALYPRAVETCLALAKAGPSDLAVVHPLIAVEAESGRQDEQRSLVSTASWQRTRLIRENTVDAMALVRWQAWKNVQGFCHIEGGWEDYDFWCKLIEGGWHGVQCPQILAVYRSHADSMSHTATNRSWRALSRTLQKRHPWLNLPLAAP